MGWSRSRRISPAVAARVVRSSVSRGSRALAVLRQPVLCVAERASGCRAGTRSATSSSSAPGARGRGLRGSDWCLIRCSPPSHRPRSIIGRFATGGGRERAGQRSRDRRTAARPGPRHRSPGREPRGCSNSRSRKTSISAPRLLAGDYRSAFTGVEYELHQVRPYEAGDDVRRIAGTSPPEPSRPACPSVELAEHVLVTWLVFDASASTSWPSRASPSEAVEVRAHDRPHRGRARGQLGLDRVQRQIPLAPPASRRRSSTLTSSPHPQKRERRPRRRARTPRAGSGAQRAARATTILRPAARSPRLA